MDPPCQCFELGLAPTRLEVGQRSLACRPQLLCSSLHLWPGCDQQSAVFWKFLDLGGWRSPRCRGDKLSLWGTWGVLMKYLLMAGLGVSAGSIKEDHSGY